MKYLYYFITLYSFLVLYILQKYFLFYYIIYFITYLFIYLFLVLFFITPLIHTVERGNLGAGHINTKFCHETLDGSRLMGP